MTAAILTAAAVTLIGLGVALNSRKHGPLFYAAFWVFAVGLVAEDVLLVMYVLYGVGA